MIRSVRPGSSILCTVSVLTAGCDRSRTLDVISSYGTARA